MTGLADFTGMEFLFAGFVPLAGALVVAIALTTRREGGQLRETGKNCLEIMGGTISFEPRKAGILLLPNLAAFWYIGFNLGWAVPLLGILTFAFCALDGLPFGRTLTATAGAISEVGGTTKKAAKGAWGSVGWAGEQTRKASGYLKERAAPKPIDLQKYMKVPEPKWKEKAPQEKAPMRILE